jgi:hypothetical protein
MKKLIVSSVLVAGLCASLSAYAQGTIQFDTTGGGYIYVGPGTAEADKLAVDLGGAELWFGATKLAGFSASTTPNMVMSTSDFGVFTANGGASYVLAGVTAGTTASGLNVRFWMGAYGDWDAAVAAGDRRAESGPFSNPTGGGGSPPGAPATLTGMPALHLNASVIPEPSTLVLAGLGAAALLMYRRRN